MSLQTLYGAAKLLQIQHAAELARREQAASSGVLAYSVHPGSCGSLDPQGWHGNLPWSSICNGTYVQDLPAEGFPNPCPFSAAQGAAVYAYAALLAPRAASGTYHSRVRGCGPSLVLQQGFNTTLSSQLYDKSVLWTHTSI
eukprot:SAG31_NODE_325_length_17671_cov_9.902743_6_plen_141_part_00